MSLSSISADRCSMSQIHSETDRNNSNPRDHKSFNTQLFRQRTMRVLIVDDENYNIEALKIILKYHCNIDSETICDKAFDGKQALEAVRANIEKN